MAIWWLKLHKANENKFCVLNAMFGIEMCASRQMSYSDWLLQATLYGLELWPIFRPYFGWEKGGNFEELQCLKEEMKWFYLLQQVMYEYTLNARLHVFCGQLP